jgi:hypothetical protein
MASQCDSCRSLNPVQKGSCRHCSSDNNCDVARARESHGIDFLISMDRALFRPRERNAEVFLSSNHWSGHRTVGPRQYLQLLDHSGWLLMDRSIPRLDLSPTEEDERRAHTLLSTLRDAGTQPIVKKHEPHPSDPGLMPTRGRH